MDKEIIMEKLWFPRLVSSGMVLQRGNGTTLSGKSRAHDRISIQFINQEYQIDADNQGNFLISFDYLEAGGPYELVVQSQAHGQMCFEDVYVGDVYIGSGQSNMELPISRVHWFYDIDWTRFNNRQLRYFKVEENPNFSEVQKNHMSGTWTGFTVDSIQSVSALGVFFLERLYQKLGIPLGFIQVALGGSPIQAWLPKHLIDAEDQMHYEEYQDDVLRLKRQEEDLAKEEEWNKRLDQGDLGYREKWHLRTDFSEWKNTDIPCAFNDLFGNNFTGVAWFAKTLQMNEEEVKQQWLLDLGTIVDADEAYINGIQIGQTEYRYPPRRYEVPQGLLKKGENTIVLRIKSFQGQGWFTPDKEYTLTSVTGKIALEKSWKYHMGGVVEPKPAKEFMSWKPTVLHNGMLAPCFQYNIKGFLWYQGESNTERPEKYEGYLKAYVQYIRQQFNRPKLPIALIQLVNFDVDLDPQNSGWPEVRETQRKVSRQEDLGLIVGIDAGEHNDLHPLNKALLAERSARYFEEILYESNVNGQSPEWIGVNEDGKNQAWICELDVHGLKLDDRYMTVDGFVAIDAKGHSYSLQALVQETRVRLNKPKIPSKTKIQYVEIRYAYENNPTGRLLYDESGLTASPISIKL